ncbi:baeRF8 domain-containing protein, partial [Eggerthella lenta]
MNDDITILADFDSALYEQVEPPLVSLYLPTHGSAPGDESDRIEFEALVEQARAKLAQERERREYKGVDERLAYAAEHFDDLMSPAPGGSLAVLAGNDRTYIYRLGYEAGPLAFVGERFYVKPLLKNFQFGSHYFLLGLSADRFAFVHGDFGSLERVELPRDVLDAFSEEFPLVYDGHEGALDYSSLENHMPPYHGWKSRNDVRKEEAGKFFQYVNKAVTDYLVAGTDLPVILVSLPE